jgi:pimeloyl-ACP methyl ester carboxylesterase
LPFLDRATAKIYYEDTGSGFPVLLFAPGFLSSRIERWRTNPGKPGVPQDWRDPIEALSGKFRVIAMDQRNAGRSRAQVGPADGWAAYTDDHLALLDHLGIQRVHVMGACIGVSFALALAKARPNLVASMVLQNPIGRTAGNGEVIKNLFNEWVREVEDFPEIERKELPGFGERMFGGGFIFSVSTADVAVCDVPMFLMPGNDDVHPADVSADLACAAPNMEVLSPWKGSGLRDEAMQRVAAFFVTHTPRHKTGG